MSLACPRLGSALLLPLRSLPASHFRKALRLPTVPLVIPPCLKPPAALLPQTPPPPQPPPTGRNAPACRKMPMSHGSVYSLGAARGGVVSSSGTSARRGRTATVARLYGLPCRRASAYRTTEALRSLPGWPTEAKETRKETAQICAAFKETGKDTNVSKETGRRRTRPHTAMPARPSYSPKSRPFSSPLRIRRV